MTALKKPRKFATTRRPRSRVPPQSDPPSPVFTIPTQTELDSLRGHMRNLSLKELFTIANIGYRTTATSFSPFEYTLIHIRPATNTILATLNFHQLLQLSLVSPPLWIFIYSHPHLWKHFSLRNFSPFEPNLHPHCCTDHLHTLSVLVKEYLGLLEHARIKVPLSGRNVCPTTKSMGHLAGILLARIQWRHAYPLMVEVDERWLLDAGVAQALAKFMSVGKCGVLRVNLVERRQWIEADYPPTERVGRIVHQPFAILATWLEEATNVLGGSGGLQHIHVAVDVEQTTLTLAGPLAIISTICEQKSITLNLARCPDCLVRGIANRLGYVETRVCGICQVSATIALCAQCVQSTTCDNCASWRCATCVLLPVFPKVADPGDVPDGPPTRSFTGREIDPMRCEKRGCRRLVLREGICCRWCGRWKNSERPGWKRCSECGDEMCGECDNRWVHDKAASCEECLFQGDCGRHGWLECASCDGAWCMTCREDHKQVILEGKVYEQLVKQNSPGMTKLECRLAVGRPMDKECGMCEQWLCNRCLPGCNCQPTQDIPSTPVDIMDTDKIALSDDVSMASCSSNGSIVWYESDMCPVHDSMNVFHCAFCGNPVDGNFTKVGVKIIPGKKENQNYADGGEVSWWVSDMSDGGSSEKWIDSEESEIDE